MTEQEQQMLPTLKNGNHLSAIIPATFDDCVRLARVIATSGLAPRDMNDEAKITVAIMHGLEIGLPPMYAIQKIAVINGRPAIWGDAVPALLWSKGFKIRERMEGSGEEKNIVATCEIERPDGFKDSRSFTWKDAEKAGLLTKKGTWQEYQKRMFQMRARGFGARDIAPDALGGLYIAEELMGPKPPIDVTPKDTVEDIPDIPEETVEAVPDIEQVEDTDQIADADGLIEQIKADIAVAVSDKKPSERIAEVAEQYEDLIERLPESHRGEAHKLLEDAA